MWRGCFFKKYLRVVGVCPNFDVFFSFIWQWICFIINLFLTHAGKREREREETMDDKNLVMLH